LGVSVVVDPVESTLFGDAVLAVLGAVQMMVPSAG